MGRSAWSCSNPKSFRARKLKAYVLKPAITTLTNTDVSLQIERRQLIWLLDGIDFEQPGAPRPVAARRVL